MFRLAIPAAFLFLAAGLLASTPFAADRHRDEIRRLRDAGQILPLETIIANHRRQIPGGQLLEVELESKKGGYIYELKMLGDDGAVREFEYDARTGELRDIENSEEQR